MHYASLDLFSFEIGKQVEVHTSQKVVLTRECFVPLGLPKLETKPNYSFTSVPEWNLEN